MIKQVNLSMILMREEVTKRRKLLEEGEEMKMISKFIFLSQRRLL